jgi:hypothetical protein
VVTTTIGPISLAVPLHFKLRQRLAVIAGLVLLPPVQGGV